MNPVKERYAELVALTKQFLLQEHALTDRIYDSEETFEYFRRTAQQQPKPEVKVAPVTSPPPPAPQLQPAAQSYTANPVRPPLAPIPAPPKPIAEKVPVVPVVESEPPAKNAPKEKTGITIEPLPPLKPLDLSEVRKIMAERLPNIPLIDTIPDDSEARLKTATHHLPNVILLSFDDLPAHVDFLTKVAAAIQGIGSSAEVRNAATMEKEIGWNTVLNSPDLRFIIASGDGIYSIESLQKVHREVQKEGRHYLGDCPLLMLPDIGCYLQDPSLKRSLWTAIKDQLKVS